MYIIFQIFSGPIQVFATSINDLMSGTRANDGTHKSLLGLDTGYFLNIAFILPIVCFHNI